MSQHHRSFIAVVLVLCLPIHACRFGYDTMAGTSSGGTPGAATTGGASWGGDGNGAASGASGGLSTAGASPGGGSGTGGQGGVLEPNEISDPGSCAAPGTHRAWSFHSDEIHRGSSGQYDSWWLNPFDASNNGNLNWTESFGAGQPGALLLEIVEPPGPDEIKSLLPKVELSRLNLQGAVITAHLYLESGEDAQAKVFAQNGEVGGEFPWANGQEVLLPIGVWICISLDLEDPEYNHALFDSTDIIALGVQISQVSASSPVEALVVYLDDFSY